MNKSLFSVLLFLHVFFLATSIAWPTPRKLDSSVDQWLPIDNSANASYIQEFGSYAVSEYDKNTTAHLEFIKVVNGSYYETFYYNRLKVTVLLWVEAKNCTNPDQSDIYETQVVEECVIPHHGYPSTVTCYKTFDYLKKLG